jgi:hypothetical protein
LEIRIAALVLGGGGLVFLLTFVALAFEANDIGTLILPAPVAVISLALGSGLIAGIRFLRLPALLWTVVVAVVQASFALLSTEVWLAVLSGLLAAAHVYGLVLQITLPARRHMGSAQ